MNFADRVALITGGAGGLGKAFARELLSRKAKVCIVDINEEQGKKVLAELQAEFPSDNVTFVVCDISSDVSFRGAFDHCKKQLGPVNLLINNAGCNDERDWKRAIDINLGGCIRGTELGLEHMGKHKDQQGGNIVNIASIAGMKVIPFGPFYSAAKAGIVHYSRSMGHPFHVMRTGVQVQSLCPSLVDTPFMKEGVEKAYSPECAAAAKNIFLEGKHPIIGVEVISTAMVQLLEDAKPGSAMVVEAKKDPYYMDPSLS